MRDVEARSRTVSRISIGALSRRIARIGEILLLGRATSIGWRSMRDHDHQGSDHSALRERRLRR